MDRRVVAVIAAGFVVVGVTLAIVFFAIVPVPDFEHLQPGEQTGLVAYMVDDETRPVRIVDLATMARVSADLPREVELVGWNEDGNLIAVDWQARGGQIVIDPHTGHEIARLDSDPQESRQLRIYPERNDGEVALREHETGTAAIFVAPDSYDIREAVALGEDRIVFVDELGRVAVTHLGRQVEPLLVAGDAMEWGGIVARP